MPLGLLYVVLGGVFQVGLHLSMAVEGREDSSVILGFQVAPPVAYIVRLTIRPVEQVINPL